MSVAKPLQATPATRDGPAGRKFSPSHFVDKLIAELAAGEVHLPSFPDFAARVQKVLEDHRATPAEVAQVVGADAALAGRVLRLANSAFLNPSANVITDLPRAVTRLGHQLVRCTALSFALKQMELSTGKAHLRKHLHELWSEGMLVASIAFVLARASRAARPDEALVAGLMHNIGKLYIAVNAERADDPTGSAEASRMIQAWHPRVGRAILKQWGFPLTIVAAVGDQNFRDRGAGAANLADVLIAATALVPCVFDRDLLEQTVSSVQQFARLGLAPPDCGDLMAALSRAAFNLERCWPAHALTCFSPISLRIISQTLSIVAVIGRAPSAFESLCTTGIGAMRSDGHAEDSLAVGSRSVLGCPAHMGAEPLR